MACVALFSMFTNARSHAQMVSDTVCYANSLWFGTAPGNRLWPDAAWQAHQDTLPRTPEWITQRLAGTYRFVEIESEGEGATKLARVWSLQLRAPDPDSMEAWTSQWGRKAFDLPLVGQRTLLMEGQLGKALKSPRTATKQDVRLHYRGRDYLVLFGAPFNVADGNGGIFAIMGVGDNGSFVGRWVLGGYGIALFPTPDVQIAEESSGYFCAFRQ
jgi:hypothetical protein